MIVQQKRSIQIDPDNAQLKIAQEEIGRLTADNEFLRQQLKIAKSSAVSVPTKN